MPLLIHNWHTSLHNKNLFRAQNPHCKPDNYDTSCQIFLIYKGYFLQKNPLCDNEGIYYSGYYTAEFV